MKATLLASVAGFVLGEDMCCDTCAEGLQKYYSVDMKHGHCGEACIKPSMFNTFKIFEKNLTIADGSTGYSSCADLGWPKYRETVTHGFGLTCTLDLYDHADLAPVSASGETCSLYEIKDDTCGQSDLDCTFTPQAKLFRKTLLDGTCAEQGFTVKTGEQTIKVPFLGDITATTYSKGAILASGETCSLYEIKDDTCGQSDLDCTYTPQAKLFRKTLIDGTCAEHGFTVKTGEQTIKVPFLGDITATTYSKGAVLASGETCSLYEIKDDTCGQSDLDCTYTPQAKLFRKTLIDGTCAEHGFTVKTGEQTIKVPFLGDITATTYSKGAILASGEDMCCQTCAEGLQKYYSVDMKHGHCGEACIKPSMFSIFKIFESNLTIADGSTGYSSCADLGWPKYRETVTHGFGLTCTLDLYDPVDSVLASGETCSLYEIKDDTCGQSDLDCTYTPQAKLFRKTLIDGTCAEHGFTVKTGEQTIKVPFLGDITATTYSKGSMLV